MTHFTEVLSTEGGRLLRADFRVVESRAPSGGSGSRRSREHRSSGCSRPRARRSSWSPRGGTRVTVVVHQRVRGSARLGGFMVRRATGRVLDEALDALEALHEP